MLFAAYLFLAIYNAGNMTTLQLQHYAIYPAVGKESFAEYIRANNRAAFVPTIVPAMLLLLVSIALWVARPPRMTALEVGVAVGLNVIAFASTFTWQRKLQGEMARDGYDEAKTRKLCATNWIRTIANLIQAVMATAIASRGL